MGPSLIFKHCIFISYPVSRASSYVWLLISLIADFRYTGYKKGSFWVGLCYQTTTHGSKSNMPYIWQESKRMCDWELYGEEKGPSSWIPPLLWLSTFTAPLRRSCLGETPWRSASLEGGVEGYVLGPVLSWYVQHLSSWGCRGIYMAFWCHLKVAIHVTKQPFQNCQSL